MLPYFNSSSLTPEQCLHIQSFRDVQNHSAPVYVIWSVSFLQLSYTRFLVILPSPTTKPVTSCPNTVSVSIILGQPDIPPSSNSISPVKPQPSGQIHTSEVDCADGRARSSRENAIAQRRPEPVVGGRVERQERRRVPSDMECQGQRVTDDEFGLLGGGRNGVGCCGVYAAFRL